MSAKHVESAIPKETGLSARVWLADRLTERDRWILASGRCLLVSHELDQLCPDCEVDLAPADWEKRAELERLLAELKLRTGRAP